MPEPGTPPDLRTRPILDLTISAEGSDVNTDVAVLVAMGEHEMRRDLARGVLRVFVIGNLAIWILIVLLVAIDVALTATGLERPAERIIDRHVVETLIAATAVQVGLIMVTIAGNLFPRERAPWWRFWD